MNITISLGDTKRGFYIEYRNGEYLVTEVLDISIGKFGVRYMGGYSDLKTAMADITIAIERIRLRESGVL